MDKKHGQGTYWRLDGGKLRRENTLAIGLKTRSTAEVLSSSKTQTGTMDTG